MEKRWRLAHRDGQSLVEFAITLPLLLLMFVGLIEVGAALRNFLIVVNANREGTRMAARGHWFDKEDPAEYEAEVQFVAERVVYAGGFERRGEENIPFLRTEDYGELPTNTTIAIHFVEVPDQVDDVGTPVYEEPLIHPPVYKGEPHESQLNISQIARDTAQHNLEFNRVYYHEQGILDIASEDNFVIVELWYDHSQWLKLPIFTEVLPETFTLYAWTQMRVTLDSRIQ